MKATIASEIKSNVWFVPLSELRNQRGTILRPVNESPTSSDEVIQGGNPFSIFLESFSIFGRYDPGTDNNDLLVRSWVKYGSEPTTERVHYFEKDVPPGAVRENFQANQVFMCREHDATNRLWLRLAITEIDKGLGADATISDDIDLIAQGFGAVFPVVLPFYTIASRLLKNLQGLLTSTPENKQVLNVALDLHTNPRTSFTLLRCGAYIFFNEAIDGRMYKLLNLRVEPATTQNTPRFDYVVITVVPVLVNTGIAIEDGLVEQQIATVLSQLDERQQDLAKEKQNHQAYLRETIQNAQRFQDLLYYYEKSRIDPSELTAYQKEQLKRIRRELRDFIAVDRLV